MKHLVLLKKCKFDGYKLGHPSMVYNFFHKKSFDETVKNQMISYKELAEALYKPIIKEFEKGKIHCSFIASILGADLVNLIKNLDFYYVVLIFIASMHEFFYSK